MARSIPNLVVRRHDPARARWVAFVLVLAWLLSMGLAWAFGAQRATPGGEDLGERLAQTERALAENDAALADTRRRLANYERSDQVSRTANESLQGTLREREEEIAALRADLAFYQRLVGGRSPRQGLTVHALRLKPVGGSGGYGFELTLTQNLKKAAITEGTAELTIEGVRDRQLTTLQWKDLVQAPDAQPLAFAFKYFQRLEGMLMLPTGFTPSRAQVVVKSKGGEQTRQAFAWEDALASGETDDVR
jgi:hypothetical protein